MKHVFWTRATLAVAAGVLVSGVACANPSMMGSGKDSMPGMGKPGPGMAQKYDQMDANKDGKVTIEEFKLAFPHMNEQAFVVIDVNGDKSVTREEWLAFTSGHARGDAPPGMRRGAPMNNIPGDPLIPPPDSNDLPLMRPPGM